MFYMMSPAFGWDYPPIIPLHRKRETNMRIDDYNNDEKPKNLATTP